MNFAKNLIFLQKLAVFSPEQLLKITRIIGRLRGRDLEKAERILLSCVQKAQELRKDEIARLNQLAESYFIKLNTFNRSVLPKLRVEEEMISRKIEQKEMDNLLKGIA